MYNTAIIYSSAEAAATTYQASNTVIQGTWIEFNFFSFFSTLLKNEIWYYDSLDLLLYSLHKYALTRYCVAFFVFCFEQHILEKFRVSYSLQCWFYSSSCFFVVLIYSFKLLLKGERRFLSPLKVLFVFA